jgi:hypothetical protein
MKKIITHFLIILWIVLVSSAIGLYWKHNVEETIKQQQILLNYIAKESRDVIATLKNRAEVESNQELILKNQELILKKLNNLSK